MTSVTRLEITRPRRNPKASLATSKTPESGLEISAVRERSMERRPPTQTVRYRSAQDRRGYPRTLTSRRQCIAPNIRLGVTGRVPASSRRA